MPARITAGASLPKSCSVKNGGPTTSAEISELLATGKFVLVTVPGAFTPTCSSQVPEFLARASEFAAKGVTAIYVITVNDAFVTKAWGKQMLEKSPTDLVTFLADDAANFTTAFGLELAAAPLLGNTRAQRSAIVVENGKIVSVAVEENPSEITVSSAESVLASL